MVTIAINGTAVNGFGHGTYWDIRGLSTDTKPGNAPNGSSFAEIDTGKGYLFDGANGTWVEIPAGSSVVIPVATGVMF
jgi:hypothetical protein